MLVTVEKQSMIFFLFHYFISPVYSDKNLNTKAIVKLVLSGLVLCFTAPQLLRGARLLQDTSQSQEETDTVYFRLWVLSFLVAESSLGCVLFSVLVWFGHGVQPSADKH